MKKLLLIILCFICFASLAQSDWDAVKVGTTDMQKIYVGENLVWEKDSCIYGLLSDYTKIYMTNIIKCDALYSQFISLSTAKSSLDWYRSCSGVHSVILTYYIAIDYPAAVNGYILTTRNGNPQCYLSPVDDSYMILASSSTDPLHLGTVPIIRVQKGIITYVEVY